MNELIKIIDNRIKNTINNSNIIRTIPAKVLSVNDDNSVTIQMLDSNSVHILKNYSGTDLFENEIVNVFYNNVNNMYIGSALQIPSVITTLNCQTKCEDITTEGINVVTIDFRCGMTTNVYLSADLQIDDTNSNLITAQFYIDNEMQTFTPQLSTINGSLLQHLEFVFKNVNVTTANTTHTIMVKLIGNGGNVAVAQGVISGYGIKEPDYDITDASDYRYIVNESDVTIIGYLGSSKRPKVPDAIEGKPVAKIECTAFNYSDVKSAVIPEGVTAVC